MRIQGFFLINCALDMKSIYTFNFSVFAFRFYNKYIKAQYKSSILNTCKIIVNSLNIYAREFLKKKYKKIIEALNK